MTTPATRVWSTPRTLTRVLVAVAGVGLFFVAASSFDPGDSSAAVVLEDRGTAAPREDAGYTSLGRYQAADHAVHIIATPEGPRYTITDATGAILESLLEEAEVNSALEAHGIETGAPVDNSPLLMMATDRTLDGLFD